MEESLITRFTKKYPNGWCVKGNNNPKWIEFNEITDILGTSPKYYYHSKFILNLSNRIKFNYETKTRKKLISVDEFLDLYNNINQEPNYEIY